MKCHQTEPPKRVARVLPRQRVGMCLLGTFE
ncbi:hypothetical protein V12B01_13415 [Vibrio splendidus 12B01]|nr:hypothetical protein V12B01_13415 [Vibrio splendidus 12B01]